MSFHVTHAADIETNTVYLPCSSYTEGNAWHFETKGPDFSSTGETIVISNKAGTIIEGYKETTVVTNANVPPQVATTSRYYEYSGNMVYEANSRLHVGGIVQETRTRRPVCGALPVRTETQTTTSGVGKGTSSQETLL